MSLYYVRWLRDYNLYKERNRGLTYKTIAERNNMKESTVKTSIRRAKKLLNDRPNKSSDLNPQTIVNRYRSSVGIETLSKEFKAIPDVIIEILKSGGIKINTTSLLPDNMVGRKQTVEKMYDSGHSKQETADVLGVSVRTVESDLLDVGIAPAGNKVKVLTGKRKKNNTPAFAPPSGGYCKTGVLDFVKRKDFLNFTMFPMQELILKIFYGLKLTDNQKRKAERLYDDGRMAWDGIDREHKELILVAGMRGSKTTLASLIACTEEHELYKHYIKSGSVSKYYGFADDQQVFILIVATNETQALDTTMAAVRSRIRGSEYYKNRSDAIKELETDFKFFDTNMIIRSGHSNSSSLAGKTSKAVIIEELSRFRDSRSGSRSSRPIYETVTRGTASFGNDGKIITITSPLEITDFCFELFDAAKDIDNMLGVILPTWEMNPNIKRYQSDCKKKNDVHLDAEYRKNPESAARDYGCECFKPLEAYFRMPDKIDECCCVEDRPIDELGRFSDSFRGNPSYSYFLHGDPAVRNDRFGLSLGHYEGIKVVIDLVHYFEAPKGGEIDIDELTGFIMNVLDRFEVDTASFDTWAVPSVKQAIEKRGVTFKNLLIDKEAYDGLKSLIYAGNLICPNDEMLIKELKGLVLVNGKKVDHLKNNSKDIADSCAGVASWCIKYMDIEQIHEVKYGDSRAFGVQHEDGWKPDRMSSMDRFAGNDINEYR